MNCCNIALVHVIYARNQTGHGKNRRKESPELTSMVMCFEDAIQEKDLPLAEENVIQHLDVISQSLETGALSHNDIPLFFIRVRNPEQFKRFARRLTPAHAQAPDRFRFSEIL